MLLALATTALGAAPPPAPTDCARYLGVAQPRPPVPNAASIASPTRPLRVWYDPTHENSAHIAPLVLGILELSWAVQVDRIGFRAPVLPDAADGPEFDAYLVDYGPFQAFVMADSYRADPVEGDGYNAASSFMVVDRELPDYVVPSYLSHEFNHACHYATDFSESTLPIWEGTATAAQEWTVGELSYWDHDVPSYQEIPWAPALTGDSYTIWYQTGLGYTYEYGAALWVMMLDEKHGDGLGSGGRDLWEAAANDGYGLEPDAVDAFAEVAGEPLGDALNELALTRFLTGADWDPRGLADAADWRPEAAVPAQPLTAGDLDRTLLVDPRPGVLGQTFFDVDLERGGPIGGADPWLVVTASSPSGLRSALLVAWWDDSGGVGDASAWGSAPTLEVPLGGLRRVMVAVTNLGPDGWDGDDRPYVYGDQQLGFAIVDRAAPPPATGTTGDTAEEPPSRGARADGCGCASAPGSGAAGLGVVALIAARRRRSASRPAPGSPRIHPGSTSRGGPRITLGSTEDSWPCSR